MDIKRIGILGCGLMGSGIALICARAGFQTVVREINEELLEKGIVQLYAFLEKSIAFKKMPESDLQQVKTHLTGTTDLNDLKDCDLVIEVVPENLELKSRLFTELDRIVKPDAIFASNTSSLKIVDLAVSTNRKDRFVGMHFFNPVPVMRLVEVVRTNEVSEEVYQTVLAFAKNIKKVGVACIDTTGFVVNRLLVPYLLDAIRAYEAGIATVRDIDNAMMLGCGHPMGPLTLVDFVGLDTAQYIADIMTREFGLQMYNSPRLLQIMVEKGIYGKKSGKGFYIYSSGIPVPNDDELKSLMT